MTTQHIPAQLAQGARCVRGYSTARRIAQQISIWLLPSGLPSSQLGLGIFCREEGVANERSLLDPSDEDLSGGEKARTCNSLDARCRIFIRSRMVTSTQNSLCSWAELTTARLPLMIMVGGLLASWGTNLYRIRSRPLYKVWTSRYTPLCLHVAGASRVWRRHGTWSLARRIKPDEARSVQCLGFSFREPRAVIGTVELRQMKV